MYPHRTKSSLVKKEMRILRALAGDDQDAPSLLETALACARNRVVVKRPRLATAIKGMPPTTVITSKKNRYDIYLIH
jgi:16S rRNA (guanine1516-N2)-methyltransferase